jgi:hypothetical protein
MIAVSIWQTEEEFARLEREIQKIRAWLDAGPDTREGRGHTYVSTMRAAGMNLHLHVKRDGHNDDDT